MADCAATVVDARNGTTVESVVYHNKEKIQILCNMDYSLNFCITENRGGYTQVGVYFTHFLVFVLAQFCVINTVTTAIIFLKEILKYIQMLIQQYTGPLTLSYNRSEKNYQA